MRSASNPISWGREPLPSNAQRDRPEDEHQLDDFVSLDETHDEGFFADAGTFETVPPGTP